MTLFLSGLEAPLVRIVSRDGRAKYKFCDSITVPERPHHYEMQCNHRFGEINQYVIPLEIIYS